MPAEGTLTLSIHIARGGPPHFRKTTSNASCGGDAMRAPQGNLIPLGAPGSRLPPPMRRPPTPKGNRPNRGH